MKMTMLLLGFAVSLLVIPALPSPTQQKAANKKHENKTKGNTNLNRIIDLAEKYNESLTKEFFVDDVSPLVDAGCKLNFFCKVYDILHSRENHFGDLVRNLKAFVDHKDVNCTVLLQNVTPAAVSIELPKVMEHLIFCIQQTNFKSSNP